MPPHNAHAASAAEPVERRIGPDGELLYLVGMAPAALPPVQGRHLLAAWDAARSLALARHAATPAADRRFRFCMPDGAMRDFHLADRDAQCWADAVEARSSLATPYGLSLCLRLLALVDLLARAAWARGLFTLARDGATLRPELVAAVATACLSVDGRFDEADLRHQLLLPAGAGGDSAAMVETGNTR